MFIFNMPFLGLFWIHWDSYGVLWIFF
jgi:hypothetical protein